MHPPCIEMKLKVGGMSQKKKKTLQKDERMRSPTLSLLTQVNMSTPNFCIHAGITFEYAAQTCWPCSF